MTGECVERVNRGVWVEVRVGYDDARVRLKMQFILAAQKILDTEGSHTLVRFGTSGFQRW